MYFYAIELLDHFTDLYLFDIHSPSIIKKIKFVESQVLGRAIEVGDRIGAPARWQHASPLRVKTIGGMKRADSTPGKGKWR